MNDTPSKSLIQYLHRAWDHNPLTALKLICNLRGVCSTGKSDKGSYYTAALWLNAKTEVERLKEKASIDKTVKKIEYGEEDVF